MQAGIRRRRGLNGSDYKSQNYHTESNGTSAISVHCVSLPLKKRRCFTRETMDRNRISGAHRLSNGRLSETVRTG